MAEEGRKENVKEWIEQLTTDEGQEMISALVKNKDVQELVFHFAMYLSSDVLLTKTELAKYILRADVRTVNKHWVYRKDFPKVTVMGRDLFSKNEVNDYIKRATWK